MKPLFTIKIILTLLLFLCIQSSFAHKVTDQQKARIQKQTTEQISGTRLTSIAEQIQNWRPDTEQKQHHNQISMKLPVQQKQTLIDMDRSIKNFKINWAPNRKTPVFIKGNDLLGISIDNKSVAELEPVLNQKTRAMFGMTLEDDHLLIAGMTRDALGMQHVRMHQMYGNLPVYGKDIYLHFDQHNRLQSINGRLTPIKKSLQIQPSITKNQALDIARQNLNVSDDHQDYLAQLLVYPENDFEHYLAYRVELKPALDQRWEVFVDAHTGEILHSANRICFDGPVNGSGLDLAGQTQSFGAYQIGSDILLIDTSKPMFDAGKSTLPDNVTGGIIIMDAQNNDGSQLFYNTSVNANQWSVPNGISAIANGGKVYDYFYDVHSRNSIDGKGGTLYMVINFQSNFNNAFWNGTFMVFGNGDGNQFSDLAGALDVTAHEMSHGVVEHTANLVYENQSGALNESFADVFGVAAEFHHNGENANWLVGEDVTSPNITGDGLRDMIDPGSDKAFGGKQPGHMDQFENLPNTEDGDNGGVHVNSGIPNRAFYLVTQDIGMDKAEKIYYRALANYLTRSSQFIDARLALVQAATDLHGENSAEVTAIKNAYDAVGITDGEGSTGPEVEPEVVGDDWLIAVDSATRGLYRISPDGSSIEQLTLTAVLNKPTVTDDGSYVLFVDQDYNPRIIGIDGANETQLDDSGIFWNLSVSPNGEKIAALSNQIDGLIYILDLVNPENYKELQLYSQTYTEGEKSSTVLFADALDWTLDSQYVLYDALNITTTATGDTIDYWDINFMNADQGTVIRVFPPQSRGVNLANPVLASNNDFIMAFDYVDASGQVTIMGANLETGDVANISFNENSLGRPDFAPDDAAIVYEYTNGQEYGVFITSLAADGITGQGNDALFLTGAVYPIWFTLGNRPETKVEEETEATLPAISSLHQNYPNPFNPSTIIRFDLPADEHVRMDIFDITGRRVATLLDRRMNAGSHKIVWNASADVGVQPPSGLYFCRINAGAFKQTIKMTLVK